MSSFPALGIAASGANVSRTWLEAVAHNVANVNTVRPSEEEPFRAQLVVAQARSDGSGAEVAGIVEAEGDAGVVYDPSHPYADEDGYVRRPVVDLATQMSDMIGAQRSYQANLSVVRSSREAYEAAMRLGK
jgi:flagellar basal-body rod protein FlgC